MSRVFLFYVNNNTLINGIDTTENSVVKNTAWEANATSAPYSFAIIAVFAADGIAAITTGIAITTESKLNGLSTKNTSTGIATSLKTANIYISNLLKHSIAEDPASIEPITIIEIGVVTSPKSSNGWLINIGSSVPVMKRASPINTAIIEGFIIDFSENLALLFPFDKKYTPSVKQRKLKGRLKIAA